MRRECISSETLDVFDYFVWNLCFLFCCSPLKVSAAVPSSLHSLNAIFTENEHEASDKERERERERANAQLPESLLLYVKSLLLFSR